MAELSANPATAAAVLTKQAKGGDVVRLEPGAYGQLMLRLLKFDPPLIVRGGPGVVFDHLSADTCSGLTFLGLEVVKDRNGLAVSVGNCDVVRFEGFVTHGGGNGFMLRNSRGVVVTGSDISSHATGINHLDCNGLEISDNVLHDLQIDGVRGGGSSNVVVRGNRLRDFYPKDGDHPDAIQFWATALNPKPAKILIEGNVYERGAGRVAQGIFIENCADVTIRDNVLRGGMINGVSLSGVAGGLVSGNFVQGYPDMGARIIVRGASADVIVRDNAANAVQDYAGSGANQRLKLAENRLIDTAGPGDDAALRTWRARGGDPRDAEIATLKEKLAATASELSVVRGALGESESRRAALATLLDQAAALARAG